MQTMFIYVLMCFFCFNASSAELSTRTPQQQYWDLGLWNALNLNQGDPEILSWLDKGANPNMPNNNARHRQIRFPIELAIARNQTTVFNALLDKGASLETALRYLANFNEPHHIDMATTVINRAGENRKQLINSNNNLALAVSRSHYEMAELLLTHGADANAFIYGDERALVYTFFTITTNYCSPSRDRIEWKANIEASKAMFDLLLSHGADRSLSCYQGKTIDTLFRETPGRPKAFDEIDVKSSASTTAATQEQ